MRLNVIEKRQGSSTGARAQAGRAGAGLRRWSFGMAVMALVALGAVGCTLPQQAPYEEMSPTEAAAYQEWQRIQRAEAQGARPARARYEKVIENYPQTTTAYEVNLVLAKQDFRSIQAQLRTSSSTRPAALASDAFFRRYGLGDHANPPTDALKARYRSELDPLVFEAVKIAGTWQILIEYLRALPNTEQGPLAEQEIEKWILNPEMGWDALDVLKEYAALRPERVRSQSLEARVEENLFQRVDERGSFEEAKRFLSVYPNSRFKDRINEMIKRGTL
jgi:hypothetical protein